MWLFWSVDLCLRGGQGQGVLPPILEKGEKNGIKCFFFRWIWTSIYQLKAVIVLICGNTMCLFQLSLGEVQVLKRTLSGNSYLNCRLSEILVRGEPISGNSFLNCRLSEIMVQGEPSGLLYILISKCKGGVVVRLSLWEPQPGPGYLAS